MIGSLVLLGTALGAALGNAIVAPLPMPGGNPALDLIAYYDPAWLYESCAAKLEAALRSGDETTLTPTDAARKSGYSNRPSRPPRARRQDPQRWGRPGAPGVACRHLPRKTWVVTSRLASQSPRHEVSAAQIVQSVINRGG